MAFIHALLDLAGLLLWLAWRGVGGSSVGQAMSLAGTLRLADYRTTPRWPAGAALIGLLVVRAIFYRQLGPVLDWTAIWSPGPVAIFFRTDQFFRTLGFSLISFGWTLLVFYTALIWVNVWNHAVATREPVTRVVRWQLGWIGTLPRPVQVLLPTLLVATIWPAISKGLSLAGLLPHFPNWKSLFQQSLIISLGSWLELRWFISAVLLLGIIHSQIFLGRHAFWEFIQVSSQQWLRPWRWLPLQIFRFDLRPLLCLALLWAFAILMLHGWTTTRHDSRFAIQPLLRTWYQQTLSLKL